jgi:hypothetical protein
VTSAQTRPDITGRAGPALNYFGPCRAWAVLFFPCFGPAHQARPKCTPIVGEGSANGGGHRGSVGWSAGRSSCQDQPVDGAKNASGASSHHRVDVPGVAVDGNRVVYGRLGANCRNVESGGYGRLAAVIDDGGVGEAGRTRRLARVGGAPR